ncbi:MAG: hypothetical protein ABWX85_14335 [Arthrobacter sp.]
MDATVRRRYSGTLFASDVPSAKGPASSAPVGHSATPATPPGAEPRRKPPPHEEERPP